MSKREYSREITEPTVGSPRTLLIMSFPKLGKTSVIGGLTSTFAPGDSQAISIGHEDNFSIVKANYEHFPKLREFESYLDDLIEDQPFTFVAFDNMSVINQWSETYGTLAYMADSMGKSFNLKARKTNPKAIGPKLSAKTYKQYYMPGDPEFVSVHTLADGNGYRWSRDVTERLVRKMSMSAKHVIFLGHIKIDRYTKDDSGKVVNSEFFAYTGAAGRKIVQDVDAVSTFYRKKTEGYLSFKHGNSDLDAGCRFNYLEGKQVLISQQEEDKSITTFFEEIYPNYEKKA